MKTGWRVVVMACAACSKAPPPQMAGPAAPPAPARPLVEVTLGDCADPATMFISGPKPMPLAFTSEAIDADLATAFGDASLVNRLPTHAGRSGPVPVTDEQRVSLMTATVIGPLDPGIVNRYLLRSLAKLQRCYDEERTKRPDLEGKLIATFTITGKTGYVTKVSTTGVAPEVESCFANVLGAIRYPLPRGKRDAVVEQTFRLSVPAPAREPFADLKGSSDGTGTAMHPNEGRMGGGAKGTYTMPDRDVRGGGATLEEGVPRRYVPGASSPLRDLQHELARCFALQPANWAVAVLDVGLGTLTAHGIDHAGFKSCVAGLASQLQATTPVRCSVTLGRAAVHEAVGVDITGTTILFNRQVTAPEEITSRGKQRVEARAAAKAPVLLDGPLVIRATPAAPMRLVNPVIDGLVDARVDYVLAKSVEGVWTSLDEDLALPVVPVPRGTGGRWTLRGFPWNPEGGIPPMLSVLVVDATSTFIGDTGGDRRQVKTDSAAIAQQLRDFRASPLFADRTSIEIAADDDVPYATLVQVLELARNVGFIDATVYTPSTLSVRFKE